MNKDKQGILYSDDWSTVIGITPGHYNDIEIKDGVTKIGAKAFENAYHIWTLKLPMSLKEIGDRAFCGNIHRVYADGFIENIYAKDEECNDMASDLVCQPPSKPVVYEINCDGNIVGVHIFNETEDQETILTDDMFDADEFDNDDESSYFYNSQLMQHERETKLVLRFENPGFCRAEEDRIIGAFRNNTGAINGHAYVDLGLPSGIKWAVYNLNALSNLTEPVLMRYGELVGSNMSVMDYYTQYGSYQILKSKGIIDDTDNLVPENDVVRQQYGEPWRLPTKKDFEELLKYCNCEFISLDDVPSGMCINQMVKVTGTNGKSIYLPLTGSGQKNPYAQDMTGKNINAYYLTATIDRAGGYSHGLFLQKTSNIIEILKCPILNCCAIRPVID